MSTRLLTKEQLSDALGVSTHTIYKWVARNEVPFIKLPGGQLRFDEKRIEMWLKVRSAAAFVGGVKV